VSKSRDLLVGVIEIASESESESDSLELVCVMADERLF